MISHNPFKEVIEITQSEAGKKQKSSQVKFSCHEFFSQIQNSTKFYFVSPRYFVSPDTKLVTVPFPYFVFLH